MEYCTAAFPDFTKFHPSKPPVCAKAEKCKNNKNKYFVYLPFGNFL